MKTSRGRLSWLLLLAAALTLSSCGEQVLVRLRTEVFRDGSLERRLEVVGRGEGGELPEEEGWLERNARLRLAEPEAWDRVERSPGHLLAEGFFPSVADVPPALSHTTDSGVVTDRNEVTLERQDLAILTRWVYRETYGDPFGPAEMEAALDGLLEMLAELFREETRREFGERVRIEQGEGFLRGELRDLLLEAFTVTFETASTGNESDRPSRWSGLLAERGIATREAGEDEDYWELQAPAVLSWMREGLALALSTSEHRVAAEDLLFLFPGPDETWERFREASEYLWGSEEEIEERAGPYLEALFGYYQGVSDESFRFEARLVLPGTLVATNGTPDAEGIHWLFRDEDIAHGEALLVAESLELVPAALRSLGARRSFSTRELLHLRDILVLRDEEGLLLASLEEAVEQADLGLLLGEEGSVAPGSLVGELVGLLDPGLLPGGE